MTGQPQGAQFEISVDGKPRSYRDTKATAIEGAKFLKLRHPHSEVTEGPQEWRSHRSGVEVRTAGPEMKDKPPPRPQLGVLRDFIFEGWGIWLVVIAVCVIAALVW